MRIRSVVLWGLSLAMIGAGLALVAFFFLDRGPEEGATTNGGSRKASTSPK